MSKITQTNGKIEITETMSTGIRVFLFLLGLLPWLAPYELLIKPGWTGFHISTLVFLSISLGAIAVSMGFIGAAIFGMNQTATFDLTARTITHRYETVINALQTKRYSFNDITTSEVREHNWDSGPTTYSLEIYFQRQTQDPVRKFPFTQRSRRNIEILIG